MKKKLIILCLLMVLFLVGCDSKEVTETSTNVTNNGSKERDDKVNSTDNKQEKNSYVSYNGKLSVSGTDIVNQYGEKIQLKGMSSHGLQWFGNFVNEENIKLLKNEWKSNLFRLAMYTEEGGYISNKSILKDLEKYIDMIVGMDMYVIIDWHILSDGNPNIHKDEAKEFFAYISKKYADVPNVIYEICNEPNGNVNWSNDIKPYAVEVIGEIRKNSKDSIIIVGTGTWSQDVLDPATDRIDDTNVMYAAHFYAGSHTDWLRDRIKQAQRSGLPIFVTEWGTSDASGNGGVFLDEAKKWVDFMEENNISWANWSLCDKNESSALLKPGSPSSDFNDDNLSESGTFVKKAILGTD